MSLPNWLNEDYQEQLKAIEEKLKENASGDAAENLIFGLFQVDLKKEIEHQFVYLKYAGLQPSQIKEMAYWEWQMMLEELNDYMEKEKEAREKEEGKQNTNYKSSKEYKDAQSSMKGMGVDPGRISTSGASGSLPRIGNLNSGGFKMPKL